MDYISEDDFEQVLSDPGQFCIVALMDGRPSGFAICREFGPEAEPDELALMDSVERTRLLSAARIGLVDSVAVDPSASGHGIGSGMCAAACERFARDGCDSAVAMAWVHEDGLEPISGSLVRSGFTRTGLVIKGYWNMWVDSEKGHMCPFCGAPCRCSAALWMRSL